MRASRTACYIALCMRMRGVHETFTVNESATLVGCGLLTPCITSLRRLGRAVPACVKCKMGFFNFSQTTMLMYMAYVSGRLCTFSLKY